MSFVYELQRKLNGEWVQVAEEEIHEDLLKWMAQFPAELPGGVGTHVEQGWDMRRRWRKLQWPARRKGAPFMRRRTIAEDPK